MQVSSNPKQDGSINCGIFCGLQYEVFARYAQAPFTVRPKYRGTRAMLCSGDHPDFLMKLESWFTEQDVSFTRTFFRAATIAHWRDKSQQTCKVVDAHWTQAIRDLTWEHSGTVPEPNKLW